MQHDDWHNWPLRERTDADACDGRDLRWGVGGAAAASGEDDDDGLVEEEEPRPSPATSTARVATGFDFKGILVKTST